MGRLTKLRRDERAATAVEYGLIIALVVLAMVAALRGVASATINMWNVVERNVVESSRGF